MGSVLRGGAARLVEVLIAARARGEAATMGVCNVTPDSFSDGGRYLAPADAIARVDALLGEGAELVDIGGESTRPGAPRVPPPEQLARVEHAVAYARDKALVSIDTTSAEVGARALALGAHVVNDVSMLSEPELARAVAAHGAGLILSHARGHQADMRGFGAWPEDAYGDVVDDVLRELGEARARAIALGVPREAIVLDPGLGFSKSSAHSLELLRRLGELVARAGSPVLVGASRKSFLTFADPGAAPEMRLGASVEAAVHAQRAGAAVVRVHDVRATRQALRLEAHLGGRAHARAEAPC